MSLPLASRSRTATARRSRDAAAHLRTWVVSRYPGTRAQEHLIETVSAPLYRPEFVPGKAYDDAMLPLVEKVVAEARARARAVPPLHMSTGTRPVLAAVREFSMLQQTGKYR